MIDAGTPLQHGTFGRSYAGFLFRSAAEAFPAADRVAVKPDLLIYQQIFFLQRLHQPPQSLPHRQHWPRADKIAGAAAPTFP
jgi:hypothetical protein